MIRLNQTWELLHYSYLGEEWNEAHLANCSLSGYESYSFASADELGVWINDLTNTTSDYSLDLNVSTGEVETMTVECLGNTPRAIEAGYNIDLFGDQVSIGILVSPQNYPFTISYEFSDEAGPLGINLFSDAPISQEPFQTDGVLLWFG